MFCFTWHVWCVFVHFLASSWSWMHAWFSNMLSVMAMKLYMTCDMQRSWDLRQTNTNITHCMPETHKRNSFSSSLTSSSSFTGSCQSSLIASFARCSMSPCLIRACTQNQRSKPAETQQLIEQTCKVNVWTIRPKQPKRHRQEHPTCIFRWAAPVWRVEIWSEKQLAVTIAEDPRLISIVLARHEQHL